MARKPANRKSQSKQPEEPTVPVRLGSVKLRLSDVVIDPDFNQRRLPEDDSDFLSLKASIREQGLLQPPGVQRRGDKYHLVWGFRRFSVLVSLYGTDHEQDFREVQGTSTDARMLNYIENLNRVDLAPFEHVEVLSAMKADGFSVAEISQKTGKSKSHVENLIRLKTKLCPELWESFVKRGREANIQKFLKAAGQPTPEEQIAVFNGAKPGGKDKDVKPSKPGEVKPSDPTVDKSEEASGETSSSGEADETEVPAKDRELSLSEKILHIQAVAADLLASPHSADVLSTPEDRLSERDAKHRLIGMLQVTRWLSGAIDFPIPMGDK